MEMDFLAIITEVVVVIFKIMIFKSGLSAPRFLTKLPRFLRLPFLSKITIFNVKYVTTIDCWYFGAKNTYFNIIFETFLQFRCCHSKCGDFFKLTFYKRMTIWYNCLPKTKHFV